MRKWKTWTGLIALFVAGYLSSFPIPVTVDRTLEAVQCYAGDRETAQACTIEISGTYYHYLLKPDIYEGRFAIANAQDTTRADCRLQTSIRDGVNPMIYAGTDGYWNYGVLLTEDAFTRLLIIPNRSGDAQSGLLPEGAAYLCAPASTNAQARAVAEGLARQDEALATLGW